MRIALRSLRKHPSFTLVATITLALGIGANTAIFSIAHTFLLRDLPYPDAERLVVVWGTEPAGGETEARVSYPDFEDWRSRSGAFEELAAFFAFPNGDVNLTGGAEPERVPVARVSSGYFRTLDVPMLYGRGFLPEENVVGRHRVAVLGHPLWRRQFDGDPDLVGRTVEVNGFPYTVVGILPPDFRSLGTLALGERVELWRPIAPDDNQTGGRGARNLRVVGRLRPGVSVARAQAELEGIARDLEAVHPETNRGRGVRVVPLREQIAGGTRPALLALLGSVALVLLIACVNVANLLLARAAHRRRETAVRLALGARRIHIVRQLLTESVLLALLGGAAGVALAFVVVRALRVAGPADLPLMRDIGVDPVVLLFATGVSVLTGIAFGLVPALQASRPDLTASLGEGGRTSGAGGGRIPGGLVVCELAVTLVLLITAGLLLAGFARLTSVDPGYDPERVLTFQLELPMGTKYTTQPRRTAFFRDLLDRLEEHPGVSAASMVSAPPMGEGDFSTTFTALGAPHPPGQEPAARVQIVGPGYFGTVGIRLALGRGFTERDDADAPTVAIVNETAARHWPQGRALGERFAFSFGLEGEVVGVVADVRQDGLESEAPAVLYLPAEQLPFNFMTVVLRTSSPPGAIVPAVRATVRALDPEQPIHNVRTLDDLISRSVARRRFQAGLVVAFAGLALTLAIVGTYGVVAYGVSRRRTEIGVRMAIGADESAILAQLTGESLKLGLIGVAIGVPVAFLATRLLRAGLLGVGALDPTAYLTAAVVLLLAVVLATLVPARRAASTHPLDALRAD